MHIVIGNNIKFIIGIKYDTTSSDKLEIKAHDLQTKVNYSCEIDKTTLEKHILSKGNYDEVADSTISP